MKRINAALWNEKAEFESIRENERKLEVAQRKEEQQQKRKAEKLEAEEHAKKKFANMTDGALEMYTKHKKREYRLINIGIGIIGTVFIAVPGVFLVFALSSLLDGVTINEELSKMPLWFWIVLFGLDTAANVWLAVNLDFLHMNEPTDEQIELNRRKREKEEMSTHIEDNREIGEAQSIQKPS